MVCFVPAPIPSFWATLSSVLYWSRGFWSGLLRQPMYISPRRVFWTVRPPKWPLHFFASPWKFPLLPLWQLRWTTLLRFSGGRLVFHAFNSMGDKKKLHIHTSLQRYLYFQVAYFMLHMGQRWKRVFKHQNNKCNTALNSCCFAIH